MSRHRFGARVTADGVSFRLWAPAAQRVDVLLDPPLPMRRDNDGWFSLDIAGMSAGTRYRFRIDGEIDVPDPASGFQPEDVFGPSEVIDHANYQWRTADWRGRPWQDAVLIETHVGTFTSEGSYRAMIDKLDHLVDTGITALELMPIADFAGQRNWGYDGVLWYAPDSAYGRPEDLKALIDAAHQRGLMVFLDVVYNHFGPEGNFLHRYVPTFFTAAADSLGQRDRLRPAGGARVRGEQCVELAARLSFRRFAVRCRQPYRYPAGRDFDAARSQHRRGEARCGDRPAHPSRAGKRRQHRKPARPR